MVSLAYSYIYCLFFINHIKLHMMVSIRKHLYKVIFQVLYHYSIYIYSIYYKHDLECTAKQHENCLAVLEIKEYESTARCRDIGWNPEKRSFCSPGFWDWHSVTWMCSGLPTRKLSEPSLVWVFMEASLHIHKIKSLATDSPSSPSWLHPVLWDWKF